MICTAVEQVVGDETWRSIEIFKHITLDMEEKRNITKDLPSVQSYVDHYTQLCTGTQRLRNNYYVLYDLKFTPSKTWHILR
jgi:hypothetical protein